jgi:hypothetical protein
MYYFCCIIMLFSVPLSLLYPGKTMAYSIVDPASSVLSQSVDRFAVGQSLVNPKTPTLSLQELVDRVAGKPRRKAYAKYGGDLTSYWEAAASQRAGKTFEAIVAYKYNNKVLNKVLAVLGRACQIVPTAVIGASSHPADLLKICNGRIVQQYQLKLGWRAAVKALQDPKYAGMSILTPKDQLAIIKKRLLQSDAVKQAIEEGRLRGTQWTPKIMIQTKQTLMQPWQEIEAAGQTSRYSAHGLETLARLGKVAGKALIAADVAGNVYFTYHDMQRFQAGGIGGGYLAIKTGLRGAQVGFTYYPIVSPEPISKVGAAVVVIVLVTADIATEWVHDVFSAAEQEAARQLLESIDRAERYHATRHYLLYAMNDLREPPTGSR